MKIILRNKLNIMFKESLIKAFVYYFIKRRFFPIYIIIIVLLILTNYFYSRTTNLEQFTLKRTITFFNSHSKAYNIPLNNSKLVTNYLKFTLKSKLISLAKEEKTANYFNYNLSVQFHQLKTIANNTINSPRRLNSLRSAFICGTIVRKKFTVISYPTFKAYAVKKQKKRKKSNFFSEFMSKIASIFGPKGKRRDKYSDRLFKLLSTDSYSNLTIPYELDRNKIGTIDEDNIANDINNEDGHCDKYDEYLPELKRKEFDELRRLLSTFVEIAEKLNLTYFLSYGSALGYIRFRSIIPWDDDIDILIEANQSERLIHYTETYYPNLLIVKNWSFIKVSFKNSTPIEGFEWGFPFLDIFLFYIAYTNIGPRNDNPVAYLRNIEETFVEQVPFSVVFPLKRGRFMGVEVNLPREPVAYVRLNSIDIEECRTNIYSHRYEEWLGYPLTYSMLCSELLYMYHFYNFVNGSFITTDD